MPATSYNLSPDPMLGKGPFGQVPGNLGVPPNIYQGVKSVYPGLSGLTGSAGKIIKSEMAGELSPETVNTIQDEAARFGVASGMPGSMFSGYRGLRNLGLNVEARQAQGLQDYSKFLGTLAPTVDDPALTASIASWNATNNAAPDPEQAYNKMLETYRRSMAQASGAGRAGFTNPFTYSPAGGTGLGSSFDGMLAGGPLGVASDRNANDAWDQWYQSWAGGVPQGGTGGEVFDVGEIGYSPSDSEVDAWLAGETI